MAWVKKPMQFKFKKKSCHGGDSLALSGSGATASKLDSLVLDRCVLKEEITS